MVPESGVSCPSKRRISVDFPTPFGPITPTLSPRWMVALKRWIIGVSPNEKDTFSASMTILPEALALLMSSLALPTTSIRCRLSSRSFLSARTRPSLRVLRALMPCLIHTSSCASFLSNSAFCLASVASCASLPVR